MRASSGATLGEISELVDMDAMFLIWVEAFDNAGYLSRSVDIILTERYNPPNLRVMRI